MLGWRLVKSESRIVDQVPEVKFVGGVAIRRVVSGTEPPYSERSAVSVK